MSCVISTSLKCKLNEWYDEHKVLENYFITNYMENMQRPLSKVSSNDTQVEIAAFISLPATDILHWKVYWEKEGDNKKTMQVLHMISSF